MIYRSLGSTGEKVSAIGVGGWHLGLPKVDEKLSLRIVRTAIDRGINFMDNCWDYNDGASYHIKAAQYTQVNLLVRDIEIQIERRNYFVEIH